MLGEAISRPRLSTYLRATHHNLRFALELYAWNIRAGAESYWFWVMLLNSRFEARIWSREFTRSFRHAPPPVDRATVHASADSIRRLRNRIAHHEPLLAHDLRGARRRASSMVAWISPEKAAWTEAHWPRDDGLLRSP